MNVCLVLFGITVNIYGRIVILKVASINIEVRSYLVENVLPSVVISIDKLLKEADKRGKIEHDQESAAVTSKNNEENNNFSGCSAVW